MVTIYNEKTDSTKKVVYNGKVKGLLVKLNLNPEAVLVARNDELLTTEDTITNKDTIKILSVVSGG